MDGEDEVDEDDEVVGLVGVEVDDVADEDGADTGVCVFGDSICLSLFPLLLVGDVGVACVVMVVVVSMRRIARMSSLSHRLSWKEEKRVSRRTPDSDECGCESTIMSDRMMSVCDGNDIM